MADTDEGQGKPPFDREGNNAEPEHAAAGAGDAAGSDAEDDASANAKSDLESTETDGLGGQNSAEAEAQVQEAGAPAAARATAAKGHEAAAKLEADAESDIPAFDAGIELLFDVELDATLQFGSKEMLLRDVLELGPGDVVELDRHIAEPVDLVVGDRIVARGEVVVANGNFALRITEVAAPQMRLESIRCLF